MKKLFALITALLLMSSFSGPKNVLIIGDSLSRYHPTGWPLLISQHYDVPIVNLSQDNKKTDWMLSTLRSELVANHTKYSAVFIYGGINDVYSGKNINCAVDNVMQMVDLCNYYQLQAVVILGYDPTKININTNHENESIYQKRYIKYQKILQELHSNATIIPVDSELVRTQSKDGIHVNGRAQHKFADWIITHL